MVLAGVDHRLDGEDHARLELKSRPRFTIMEHLRFFMELTADAMTAILAHDRKTMGLGVTLDGVADVAQLRARPHLVDPDPQAFIAHLDQTPGPNSGFTDKEHAAGIPMIAMLDNGDINVDDVSFLEFLVSRDPVADDVVNRGADRFGEPAVVQRSRNGALGIDDII